MKRISRYLNGNIRLIFKKIIEVNKYIILIYLCLTILSSTLPVFMSIVQRDVINFLVNYSNESTPQNQLVKYCLIIGGVSFIIVLCDLIIQYIQNIVSLRYKKNAMLKNVEKMSSLEMLLLDDPNAHFLFDMSCEEPNTNPFEIIMPSIRILTTCVTAVSYYIILFKLNPLMAILPLIISIPLVKVGQKKELYDYQSKYNNDIMTLNRRVSYFTTVVKEPIYAKDNIIYNVGNFFIKKRRLYKDSLIDKKLKFIKKSVVISIMISLIISISKYFIYWLMGYNVMNGNISIGNLTLYFNAFSAILISISIVVDSITYLNAQINLHNKRTEFMALPSITPMEKEIINDSKKHNIEFRNVTFAYPNTNINIIDNLSFTINHDDVIAMMGENGSGKSTLIKLLIGQYTPQKGYIKIDGIDIKQYSQKQLSNIFGVMFQEVAHVAITIKEFVTLSDQDYDDDKFNLAITKARCDNILRDATAGSNTIMGLNFNSKNAKDFSGGEWQRLAMARMFYSNSDIFIMDEPTAALDAEAEYKFYENLQNIAKDHTVIMVSHRLSIANLCTKIIYFNGPKIVVSTHEQLMKEIPEYKQLYEIQKSMYFKT